MARGQGQGVDGKGLARGRLGGHRIVGLEFQVCQRIEIVSHHVVGRPAGVACDLQCRFDGRHGSRNIVLPLIEHAQIRFDGADPRILRAEYGTRDLQGFVQHLLGVMPPNWNEGISTKSNLPQG